MEPRIYASAKHPQILIFLNIFLYPSSDSSLSSRSSDYPPYT